MSPQQHPPGWYWCTGLIYTEIEAEAKNLPAERMHRYYMQLCLKHAEPILPIALYLTGGKGGILLKEHKDTVWEFEVSHFRYLALGLEKGEAEAFLDRPEPLAWALTALMKPTKLERWQVKLEALRKIDSLVKRVKPLISVIPANAGIH